MIVGGECERLHKYTRHQIGARIDFDRIKIATIFLTSDRTVDKVASLRWQQSVSKNGARRKKLLTRNLKPHTYRGSI